MLSILIKPLNRQSEENRHNIDDQRNFSPFSCSMAR